MAVLIFSPSPPPLDTTSDEGEDTEWPPFPACCCFGSGSAVDAGAEDGEGEASLGWQRMHGEIRARRQEGRSER